MVCASALSTGSGLVYPGRVIGDADRQLRLMAFEWLTTLRSEHGDLLPRSLLEVGFEAGGTRVRLLGPQGIFKPAAFQVPISVTTSPNSPYQDRWDDAHRQLLYSFRGLDPLHPDNAGLRRAMIERVPLVYFHGVAPGSYLATYPVFVTGEDRDRLLFAVQADEMWAIEGKSGVPVALDEDAGARRGYATSMVRRRLHQVTFRARVIRAYQTRCALCRLRHTELLDAAHITPDADPEGEPLISNGLALCKLHHAAFDRFFFTVRPDYTVEVRESILAEADGPMLVVGLQQIHGQPIFVPSALAHRPDRVRLERRYQDFRQAS